MHLINSDLNYLSLAQAENGALTHHLASSRQPRSGE
jgi:hypothetical protein